MRHSSFLALIVLLASVSASWADDKPKRPANRLAKESSPYLRQHAHNPVDWYPWGAEAFEKAKKDNKIVFLSIGYSSCHWCHVMERESFDNEEVAKILNEHYVCIKVDREERPDIDHIYMTALNVGFRQRGGWPLSMFLMPDGKPIIGGTYWPPEDRMIEGEKVHGFKSILRIMLDVKKNQLKEITAQSQRVAEITAEALSRAVPGEALVELDRKLMQSVLEDVAEEYDEVHGGFGNKARRFNGTKFPVPTYLELILTELRRTKSADLQKVLDGTLDHMARGGIYDHLGGGFHRYSTERTWTVPHFEKMLYDNAQLVEVYAQAHALDPRPQYRKTVRETLEFIAREMTGPEGEFYSALDADSEGEEGKFYVWSPKELEKALANREELDLVRAVYGVDGGLNFEKTASILMLPEPFAEIAAKRKLSEEQLEAKLLPIRQKLLALRAARPRPFLDSKVLTAWNGQMIAGYAVAGRVFKEPKYIQAGSRAAEFILKTMRTADGRLKRSWMPDSGAKLPGYSDDYAFLVHGLLALHDATNDARWLNEAKALTEAMIKWHLDEKGGGFFFTSHDHEKLFARAKDQYDGAQPCANSMAARNLVRLAKKTGEARYRTLAEKTIKTFVGSLKSNGTSLTLLGAALNELLETATPAPKLGGDLGKPGGNPAVKSDSVVKVTASADKPGADGKQVVTITMDIDKGWHSYANPAGNEMLDGAKTVVKVTGKGNPKELKVDYPRGKKVEDKLVGDYLTWEGKVEIKVTIQRAAGDKEPLEVSAKFMACEEGKDGKPGKCLLPATVKLAVP